MAVTIKERLTLEEILPSVQFLSLEARVKLLQAVGEMLPPAARTQVILHLLPPVAPTIEAFLLNKTPAIIAGGTSEETHQLMTKCLEAPAEEEEDASWDAIMSNIGAYASTELQA